MTPLSIALMAEHPANVIWVTIGSIISGAGIMGLGYWGASRISAAGEPLGTRFEAMLISMRPSPFS